MLESLNNDETLLTFLLFKPRVNCKCGRYHHQPFRGKDRFVRGIMNRLITYYNQSSRRPERRWTKPVRRAAIGAGGGDGRWFDQRERGGVVPGKSAEGTSVRERAKTKKSDCPIVYTAIQQSRHFQSLNYFGFLKHFGSFRYFESSNDFESLINLEFSKILNNRKLELSCSPDY